MAACVEAEEVEELRERDDLGEEGGGDGRRLSVGSIDFGIIFPGLEVGAIDAVSTGIESPRIDSHLLDFLRYSSTPAATSTSIEDRRGAQVP